MINYYQQGGAVQQDEQDEMLQKAIVGLYGYNKQQGEDVDIQECLSQVAQLISKQPDTLQKIAQSQDLVQLGVESLEQDDPDALQQLSQPGAATQAIQQVLQGAEQQAVQAARYGAKLNYLRGLKGECPEGYYKAFYKAGGQLCPVCKKKQEQQEKIQSAKCGKKMKKGAVTKAMNGIRTEMFGDGEQPGLETRKLHRNDKVAVDIAAVPGSKQVIERAIIPTPHVGINDTIFRTYPDRDSAGNMDKYTDNQYVVHDEGTGRVMARTRGYDKAKRLFDPKRVLQRKSINLVDADNQYSPYYGN